MKGGEEPLLGSPEFSALSRGSSLVGFLFHPLQCLCCCLQISYPLRSADNIMPSSQQSSHPPAPYHPSLTCPCICMHIPVLLGESQFLAHTNPSTCALHPVASYVQGPPSIQIIPSRMVRLGHSIVKLPFLSSCVAVLPALTLAIRESIAIYSVACPTFLDILILDSSSLTLYVPSG